MAAKQPIHFVCGRATGFAGYFRRSNHAALACEKRVTDRLSGVLAGSSFLEEFFDDHAARQRTSRSATFVASKQKRPRSLRRSRERRNYLRLARARHPSSRASASLQHILRRSHFCGEVPRSDAQLTSLSGKRLTRD